MVNHVALMNVDMGAASRDGEELTGIHIPFSHACIDQLATSKVVTITQDQHEAGYVWRKARRMNEIVIGTRFRYPIVRDEAAFTNEECNVTLRAIK
jgi:hypothetical protein